nr:hypothetical protein [uncultured bacterium]
MMKAVRFFIESTLFIPWPMPNKKCAIFFCRGLSDLLIRFIMNTIRINSSMRANAIIEF